MGDFAGGMLKYLRAHPDMTIARYRQMTTSSSAEFLSMYVEGLRMAGMPE